MFRVSKYEANADCVGCEKNGKPTVHVECDAGTFEGPMCQACFFAEVKKRSRKPNGQPPAPKANQDARPIPPAAVPAVAVPAK